jgi:hypothetical protein
MNNGQSVTAAIGFENESGFASHFETNIQAAMQGVNSGVYLRIPFTIDDLADIGDLTSRMKYDDGYVLYLNGNLVDIQNGPFSREYDSTANTARPNEEAVVFEESDLSDFTHHLQPGTNILALHGLNLSVDDQDFLLVPELSTTVLAVMDDTPGFFSSPTPGGRNPAQFSLGPVVDAVQHLPAQPGVSDPLVVTADIRRTVADVASVSLTYRVMYEQEVELPMSDTGSGSDEVAGDGIYTAVIPAGIAEPQQMLRYYVSASDVTGETFRSPRILDTSGTDQSPEYYGTVIADPSLASDLPILQWFTNDLRMARDRRGTRASVFYAGEFYDNVFVRQRGGASNPNSQKFNFGDEQPFYVNDQIGRVSEFNMNAPGGDSSYLRQTLAYESYTEAGHESSESFLVLMRVNGSRDRVGIFIEQVDENFLERQELDPEGALYKFVQRHNLDPVFRDTITGIEKKTRLNEGLDDIQLVVDGLNLPTATERANSVFDNFNVAQLMNYLALRSITMDADDVRKNFYLYRDSNGTQQWSIFPWDKDWTFGVTGDGGTHLTHPFFGDYEHRKQNANQWNVLYDTVFNDPVLREMYLRRLRTAMDQLLQPPGTPADEAFYEQWVDELYAQAADELPRTVAGQVRAIKNFFRDRREDLYVDHLMTGEFEILVPEFVDGAQYFVPTDNDLGLSWTGLEPPANIEAWSSGETGFGFATRDSFLELIRTTVRPTDACGTCTSIYVRIPFHVPNPADVDDLTLRMKYDDGFIAYINGEEVTRARYDGEPTFDARARTHVTSQALIFQNHLIDVPQGLLRAGENVLSIHAINSSPTSNDMLMLPVLVNGIVGGENAAGIPHAQVGNPEIHFGAFDQDPISGDQDQEFIELANPNGTAVDITGWRLTGGIEHVFPAGTVIPANRSLYVTPSVPAFLARTDGPRGNQGLFVQGNYEGHLSNYGEIIQLVATDGSAIDSLATPSVPTEVQQFLRISEIYYNPPGAGDHTEFIELTNISQGHQAVTLDLGGVTLSEGPAEPFRLTPGTLLAPGEHLLVVKNQAAFQTAHPEVAIDRIAGVYLGSLNNDGELLKVDDARGNTVVEFAFNDSSIWPQSPDGAGSSLELIDPLGTPIDQMGKSYVWRSSSEWGGSPGETGQGPLGVVINEVVSNAGEMNPRGDAIELWNPTAAPINIGGWYLSDSAADLLKYRILAGTLLLPGEHIVFDESHFNPVDGGDRAFALSATDGDDVWLSVANEAGQVTAIVDDVHFGPSVAGESFGRLPESPGRLFPMNPSSLGEANTAARVGPVVISEVHYHPAAPGDDVLIIEPELDVNDLEFVEIFNTTLQTVDLSQWRLEGGVDFDFPAETLLAAGDTILVVSFNPDRPDNAARTQAFRAHFGLASNVRLLGGYAGRLSDSQDRVSLQRVALPAGQQLVHLWEDEVVYDDRDPWPSAADGQGDSLQRISTDSLGTVANSWTAALPTPDDFRQITGDINGDGQVDVDDIHHLCEAMGQADPSADLDGSGQVDQTDLEILVRDVLGTDYGDANLDRVFNSSDLVQVFQAGEYEDALDSNSTWAEGDWNCDKEFNSSDLVVAFQTGSYEAAARPAARISQPLFSVPGIAVAVLTDDHGPLLTESMRPEAEPETECLEHRDVALRRFLDSWVDQESLFPETLFNSGPQDPEPDSPDSDGAMDTESSSSRADLAPVRRAAI